jgi:hypothetical protein
MVMVVEWEALGVQAGRLVLEEGVVVVGSKEWLVVGENRFLQMTQIKLVGGTMHFHILKEIPLQRGSWMILGLVQ